MADIHDKKILILDFGSQYTQLIARRVREAGVYSEIVAYDIDEQAIHAYNPSGIILSGGPETVTAGETSPRAPKMIFELGVPVLGICYGLQTMAEQLGGKVSSSDHREFGYAQVEVDKACHLLAALAPNAGDTLEVWMSHGDKVIEIPDGFTVTAKTRLAPIAAIANEEKQLYGLQFHPEVTHTKNGQRLIERFVHDICGCGNDWNAGNIVADAIAHVKEDVGDDTVILGLSGGVDSSVVAALLHKAIGKQLVCIFVNTGLVRKEDEYRVDHVIREHLGVNVVTVDARDRYFSALAGVAEPEAKRKIIGKLFVDIFEEEAAKYQQARWLAQGTIYSDVIESGASKQGKGHVIKSHHNVGGLPEEMNLKLIEPLRELFKDEVRAIGLELGLPYDLVHCHPFPGPGLGVRVLAEVKPEYVALLRDADAIFMEELRESGLYHKVSQAFSVFLPVKSVAVMGDARKYDYVIALRAIESIDFMTAHWAHLPYDFLGKVSNRIINEVQGISRVVYDISGKPPATIEWE